MFLKVHTHLSPRIIEIYAPTTDVTVQEIVNVIREWEDDPWNMTHSSLIKASGKQQLGGGVLVGITAELQNAQLMFASRPTPLSTGGVCVQDDSVGQTLTVSGIDFISDGIYVGCTVFNSTTASMAAVSLVSSSTVLSHFKLDGGFSTEWTYGDSVSVYPNAQCNITGGNLVAIDTNGFELSPVMQSPNTQVVRTSSASATLSDLDAIQYSSYGGGINVDVINGVAGNKYPIGNVENPVDNLVDAIIIANEKGFKTLFIKESMIIGSGQILTNFTLEGRSQVDTKVTVLDSAVCYGITIINCTVTGILDGGTNLRNCIVYDVTYVNGHINHSGLYGYITLDGNQDAVFADCYTVDQDNPVVIDMGGLGQSLAMPNYSGLATIKNLSDSNSEIGIGLNAGMIILDETVVSGTSIISGVGMLTDNSGGGCIVNTDGLMSKATISRAVYDEIGTEIEYASYNNMVAIDVDFGVSGTIYNVGTSENPVNNIIDAKSIANYRGFNTFFIKKNMVIDSGVDITDFNIVGRSRADTEIVIDPLSICNGVGIERCNVSGTLDGNIRIRDCVVGDLIYANGHILNSSLYGTIILDGSEDAYFKDCGSFIASNPPIIDMGGSGQNCILHDYSGGIKFKNMTGNNAIRVQMDGGNVWLDSTIVSGTVAVNGIGVLHDNTGDGCVVNDDGLLNAEKLNSPVWDEIIINVIDGSAGTTYPIGTHRYPVNNLTDALTIANANYIEKFHVHNSLTIESTHDISSMFMSSGNIKGTLITLDVGCSVNNASFKYVNLQGTISNGDEILVESCGIFNLVNFAGIMQNVIFNQNDTLTIGSWADIHNCRGGSDLGNEYEINVGNSVLNIQQCQGNLKLINKTGSNRTTVGGFSANILIEPSCVSGDIQLLGTGIFTDNSIGTCVVDDDGFVNVESVVDSVWEAEGSGLTSSGIASTVWSKQVSDQNSTLDGTFGKLLWDMSVEINDMTIKLPIGNIAESGEYSVVLNNIETKVIETLGLSQNDYYLDQNTYTDYQGIKLLTGGRIRTYSVNSSVGSDSDIISTYQITSVWNNDELSSYKVVKQ